MKKIVIAMFAVVFASLTLQANDNKSVLSGAYVGLGTGFGFGHSTSYSVDARTYDGMPTDFSKVSNTLNIFAGYNILPYLAIEGEYNYGLNKEELFYEEEGYKEYNNFTSHLFLVNLVGKYTILEKHIPFVKFGLGYGVYGNDFTSKEVGYSDEVEANTYSGLAYAFGLGYEFAITKNHSVVAEYSYVATTDLDHEVDFKDGVFTENGVGTLSYSTFDISYNYSF